MTWMLLVAVVAGAAITAALDSYLGIDLSEHDQIVKLVHRLSYMLWGVWIALALRQ